MTFEREGADPRSEARFLQQRLDEELGVEPAGTETEAGIDADASYVCGACGEEIVVPIDLSAGAAQDYVEDCPVCCRPHRLEVQIDPDGAVHVSAELE